MRPTNADTGVVGAHAVPAQDAGQLPGGVLHPLAAAGEDAGGSPVPISAMANLDHNHNGFCVVDLADETIGTSNRVICFVYESRH